MADSSHQAWLATLDPEVRLQAEAEVAFYVNEDLWDYEIVDEDSAPAVESGMGLTVSFTAEEVRTILYAFGHESDFAGLMKEKLLLQLKATQTGGATLADASSSQVDQAGEKND